MGKLRLTVNEEKTRVCKVPEGVDFLDTRSANVFADRRGPYRYRPSKKSIQRVVEKVHALPTEREHGKRPQRW